LELSRRFYNRGPGLQYYLEKMMPKEAEPLIEKELKEDPEMGRIQQIQLLSLHQGRHAEAQAAGLEFLNTVLKIGVIIITHIGSPRFRSGRKERRGLAVAPLYG